MVLHSPFLPPASFGSLTPHWGAGSGRAFPSWPRPVAGSHCPAASLEHGWGWVAVIPVSVMLSPATFWPCSVTGLVIPGTSGSELALLVCWTPPCSCEPGGVAERDLLLGNAENFWLVGAQFCWVP